MHIQSLAGGCNQKRGANELKTVSLPSRRPRFDSEYNSQVCASGNYILTSYYSAFFHRTPLYGLNVESINPLASSLASSSK